MEFLSLVKSIKLLDLLHTVKSPENITHKLHPSYSFLPLPITLVFLLTFNIKLVLYKMSLFSAKIMFNVPYLKIRGIIYQIQNKEKVSLFL